MMLEKGATTILQDEPIENKTNQRAMMWAKGATTILRDAPIENKGVKTNGRQTNRLGKDDKDSILHDSQWKTKEPKRMEGKRMG